MFLFGNRHKIWKIQKHISAYSTYYAVGIVATSVVSAILVGLLVASLALTFTGSACLVKCLADCDGE